MEIQPSKIVFEGRNFIVVDISDKLPRHRNFPYGARDVKKPWNDQPAVTGHYYEITDRELSILYLHQTGGSVHRTEIDAVLATTNFVVSDPAWVKKTIKNQDKWVWTGTGRGWPGCPYTYYLPYVPMHYKGKIVIFRCWSNDWITWHSSDNQPAIALVCQGYFASRHIRGFKPRPGCPDGKPSDDQLVAVEGFIYEYAIGELGIDHKMVRGHCDSPRPKLTCPGDRLEKVVRTVQENRAFVDLPPNNSLPLEPLFGALKLETWEERQAALVFVGHDLGAYGKKRNGVDGDPGYRTRLAIEAQEEIFGMPVDGYWDDTFDITLKMYLAATGVEDKDIQALIP